MLCIQNIACEKLGTFERQIASHGYTIELLQAGSDSLPTSLSNYSAVIILGGPMAVYDNLQNIEQEQKIVRSCVAGGIPVLGVCLGSQIIAQALGGNVFRGSRKEIGWSPVQLSSAGRQDIFNGFENTLQVFHWHGDTFKVPPQAQILAWSDDYVQAFRIGTAIGIQFHLEVDIEMIKQWSVEYASEVKSEHIVVQELLNDKLAENLANSCKIFCNNFFHIVDGYYRNKQLA